MVAERTIRCPIRYPGAAMKTAVLLVLSVVAATSPAQHFIQNDAGLPTGQPGTASDSGWSGMAIADVDNDTLPDVVVTGRKGTGARVFRYQGSGAPFLEYSNGLARPLSGRSEVVV